MWPIRPRRNGSAAGSSEASRCLGRGGGEAGFTLLELITALALMAIVTGSLFLLVAAGTRSRLIVAARAADTESARRTLEWMSERLRNAGLNILPGAQAQVRCQDMVVAQDAGLRPTSNAVYVSGEILNSDTTAGNQVMTIGFRLGTHAQTGNTVVLEDKSFCSGPWTPSASVVSDPRIAVTSLVFEYFDGSGSQVPIPTADVALIRSIRLIRIALTVQGEEGSSGVQTQTFARRVKLRNPRPDQNLGWLSPTETNP